ncbi:MULTISPECIES: UxaA family hydrolase [unclassified Agarivorans]|uniref:UxaA family hydrolase n=1 Tax=unclassified Agarivorans TaxID=2636026 RepID=UPI003D7CE5FC
MDKMKTWIQIHPRDNVIIALEPMLKGTEISIADQHVYLQQNIDKGHKVAIAEIAPNGLLVKYGEPFGHATEAINCGEWIHSHNAKTNLNDKSSYQYTPSAAVELLSKPDREVQLYRRSNGEVAVRNEIWIIPTVGCVNGIAQQIAKRFLAKNDTSMIDGVHVFTHQFGCSQLGDDHQTTKKLLQSMATHPNAGGTLVIGLGCENNQIVPFRQGLAAHDPERIEFMVAQHSDDEVEQGLVHLQRLFDKMQQDRREPGKLSEVRFGLECGGSDGLSGITANPMLGLFSDTMVAHGGTTVLTEVPEMFGAETILMNRAKDQVVFDKIVDMVNNFKEYYLSHDLPVYENPSPGNKAGGITTLEDKSLGCTQKAGSSQVIDVIDYTEKLSKPGLNLLNAPGNDAIATSALGASGCHMVLFTTGRGTPYGGFVPTVKIATNSDLASRKPHWIDFNAGALITDNLLMPELLDRFLDHLAKLVSGELTKNEYNDIRELAIWKNGVTL